MINKKMKKTFKTTLLLATMTLMAVSCSNKKDVKENATQDQAEQAPLVEVEIAGRQNMDMANEYTATVQAFKTNNISSNSGSRIKRVLVDVGSHVSAGQSVVILDDANIAQQQIAIAAQKRDLDRAKELVRIGGGTQQTVDQLQAQYDANMRAMRNMRENTVLTSPISGVVTVKNYDNGDLPSGMPVLVIEQQQPLKVIVNVNESEMPKVKKGMPVSVKFDTYEGENFTGHVHLIHPTVDPHTRSFQVEVTIHNLGDKVDSGMFARVSFNFGSSTALTVSDVAVQKQTGSGVRYVYTLESDGSVKFREVELGRREGTRYEVLSGISEGMKIVTAGHARLVDGKKVRLKK